MKSIRAKMVRHQLAYCFFNCGDFTCTFYLSPFSLLYNGDHEFFRALSVPARNRLRPGNFIKGFGGGSRFSQSTLEGIQRKPLRTFSVSSSKKFGSEVGFNPPRFTDNLSVSKTNVFWYFSEMLSHAVFRKSESFWCVASKSLVSFLGLA